MTETQHTTVAFLGPKGSYTHQAALNHFPDPARHDIVPLTSIDDVFAAVQTGRTDCGVVPFENSSNGSVIFTLDLFADLDARNPDILVCAETYVRVRHCLVGYPPPSFTSSTTATSNSTASPNANANSATPTPDLHTITKLYSHPQAWGQCKAFLSTHFKGVERQDVSSTSRAAEIVRDDRDRAGGPHAAAISSRIAADINGLEVLVDGIEDWEGNTTRFFVLRRRGEGESGRRRGGDGSASAAATTTNRDDVTVAPRTTGKTLVAFTVDQSAAGALADCLAVFKKWRLNLTSINTRPGRGGAGPTWQYVFFVEFVGMRMAEEDDGGECPVEAALRELGRVASAWRWLGSWEDNALGQHTSI